MKTETNLAPRKPFLRLSALAVERLALAAIIALAAGLRLWHLGFGLPALNDPDEPVFVMTAIDMLREHRLDPQWYGHPGTLLFYALAVIFAGVGLVGSALGRWHGTAGFVTAAYADPGIVILPMRLFIATLGVVSVWQTYCIGKRMGGTATGLAAALLLAVNGLHIALSQVIRTDMLATVLMLASTSAAITIAQGGERRSHGVAGIFAGLACATKWPAILVLANTAGATWWQQRRQSAPWRQLWIAPSVAVASLLLAAPFLLIDHAIVLHDLGGEARPHHLGASGHGLFANLVWYLRGPLAESFGWAGIALAGLGAIEAIRHHRPFAAATLPGAIIVLFTLAAQSLVWERWLVPLLPVVALLAAVGVMAIVQGLCGAACSTVRATVRIALLVVLVQPMLVKACQQSAVRANDTRQAASAWILAHVPAGRSILVEQAAFDLLPHAGPLLFPIGERGCIDVRSALAEPPSYKHVNTLRDGRPIVDIGTIPPAKLGGCRADVVVFAHFRRYREEAELYEPEIANYRWFLRQGRIVQSIVPILGKRGGPLIDIVVLFPAQATSALQVNNSPTSVLAEPLSRQPDLPK